MWLIYLIILIFSLYVLRKSIRTYARLADRASGQSAVAAHIALDKRSAKLADKMENLGRTYSNEELYELLESKRQSKSKK